MITHAQASISFLQRHERDYEPTNVLRAGEQQGDLTPASQSSRKGQPALTTRQSFTEGTAFSSQILHHLSNSGSLRRGQVCPVLLFSPWTAHKPGRCCESVTSCVLLSLSSSTNMPPPSTEIPLFSCSGASAHLQDLSCPPRVFLLSLYHTSEPEETQPCLAEMAFPFHCQPHPQLFTHPPKLTLPWLPPSSIQSSFLGQSGNNL